MIPSTAFAGSPSTAVSASWKGATATSGAEVFQAVPAAKASGLDSVSISKLGQALAGRSAEAFQALDKQAQDFLVGLVESGRIGAKDAAKGLEALATEALFLRFSKERPRDEEDTARGARLQAITDTIVKANPEFDSARQEQGLLGEAYGRGEIDHEEFSQRWEALRQRVDAAHDARMQEIETTAGGDANQVMGEQFSATLHKNLDLFKGADRGPNGEALAPPYDEEGSAAKDALAGLGFDARVYGHAFGKYAAAVDIPGVGPGAESTAPDRPPTSAEPAKPASGGAARAAADPSNSAAAIAMLQQAVGPTVVTAAPVIAGPAEAAANESTGAISALLKALKAGDADGQAGHDETV